jgi:uncharacterized protein YndB with AHSA1/START domain
MTDGNAQQDAVVIERSFDAPAALIWQMWTEPEHFRAWYGPDGAAVPVAKMDVRVGGSRLVCMEMDTPDGPARMWLAGQYREVTVNKRLVYTEFMSDQDGNMLPPAELGLPAGHPAMTEVTVELTDLGARTRVVLTHSGVPAGSPGAAGWAMALSKLAAHVEAAG